jgi:aspartyl-tRNA(Asn)/glutamyl-tRNA(Gln) amidotransferase subunit B
VNDGNLEEGSFRCDANVSIRPVGTEKFGTRCELKNINSFKFVQRAIDAEIIRQTAILDAGGKVKQETRSFDPDTGLTHTLRAKDDAHDYRYFPEPDLPPLRLDPAFIAAEREGLRELPVAVRKRWVAELGLTPATALTLTQHPLYVSFFESVCQAFNQPVKVANFVANEVLRGAKTHGLQATFSVTPAQVAELLCLVESGEISGKQAKEVFALLEGTDRTARSVVEERGLKVVSDAGALEALCLKLIEKNPSQAASVRAGKKALIGFFMGQVMKETGGSANPKLVNDLFEKLLGAGT